MDSGPATSVEPAGPTSPPPPVPEGWLPQYDPSSQEYYYVHRSTNHSQWETPTHSLPTPTTTPHDPAQSRLPAPSNEYTQAAAADADSQDGAEGSRGLFSKNKIQESYYDQNEIHEPYYDQYEHHEEDFPSKYGGTHHASETSALSQAVAPAQTSRLASGMGQLAQSLLGRVANSVLDAKLSGQQGQHQQQSHNMAVQGMHQPGSHSLLHSLLGSNTTQNLQAQVGYVPNGQPIASTGGVPQPQVPIQPHAQSQFGGQQQQIAQLPGHQLSQMAASQVGFGLGAPLQPFSSGASPNASQASLVSTFTPGILQPQLSGIQGQQHQLVQQQQLQQQQQQQQQLLQQQYQLQQPCSLQSLPNGQPGYQPQWNNPSSSLPIQEGLTTAAFNHLPNQGSQASTPPHFAPPSNIYGAPPPAGPGNLQHEMHPPPPYQQDLPPQQHSHDNYSGQYNQSPQQYQQDLSNNNYGSTVHTSAPPVQQQSLPQDQDYHSGPHSNSGYNSGPGINQGYNNGTPPNNQGYGNGPTPNHGYNNGPPLNQGYNGGPPPNRDYNSGPPSKSSYDNGHSSHLNHNHGPPSEGYNNSARPQNARPPKPGPPNQYGDRRDSNTPFNGPPSRPNQQNNRRDSNTPQNRPASRPGSGPGAPGSGPRPPMNQRPSQGPPAGQGQRPQTGGNFQGRRPSAPPGSGGGGYSGGGR